MTKILKLVAFLDTPRGRTLQEVAEHFGVATRSVQRWIARIEPSYQGLTVEHLWDETTQKRFRCSSPSKLLSVTLHKRDVLAIWSMTLAAQVLRSSGLTDDADAIAAVQALALKDVPRGQRLEIEKRIAVLASGEKVPPAQSRDVAAKGVPNALRLAMIHGRTVTLTLRNDKTVVGRVKAILHASKIAVTLETGRGEVILPLSQILDAAGVEDLFQVDFLNAA